MDTSRLGRGEMIAGVSAVLLFIVMFFGWFGLSAPDGAEEAAAQLGVTVPSFSFSAWESYDFTDLILLLTIIVTIGAVVSAATAREVTLPVAASALVAGLGILSLLFVAWSIINTPSEGPVDLDRKLWVFVGLILTAGIAYGGWVSMQEEGTSFGDQADRFQGGGDAPPPPPPAAGPPAA